MLVEIRDKLYKDILSYCELNGLPENDFINETLKDAYMVIKYGERPGIPKPKQVVSEPLNEPISEPIKPAANEEKERVEPIEIVVEDEQIKEENEPEEDEEPKPKKTKRRLS